jgi:hypothetical protein
MARLEWLTARLLLVGGVIVIVGGFFGGIPFRNAPQNGNAAQSASAEAPTPSRLSPGQVFCGTAVSVAENFGIVPEGTRAGGVAHKTDVQGRYVCEAANGPASFVVAVELECANIRDQACFSLYAVRASDGTVLYQRQ